MNPIHPNSSSTNNQSNGVLFRASSTPAVFGDEPSSSSNSSGAQRYRKIFPQAANYGPLIAPNTALHAQAVMGNVQSEETNTRISGGERNHRGGGAPSQQHHEQPQREQQQQQHEHRPPRSNLTALLESQLPVGDTQRQTSQNRQQETSNNSSPASASDEADSASGPPPSDSSLPPAAAVSNRPSGGLSKTPPAVLPSDYLPRHQYLVKSSSQRQRHSFGAESGADGKVPRRCISSKELGALAPPSGSPYAYMVQQKELLEFRLAERLRKRREDHNAHEDSAPSSGNSSSVASATRRMANETRNQRRAVHNQAVTHDLCEIVTDMFMAECKLINPSRYGVDSSDEREKVYNSVQHFIEVLPPRYALGVDTPSEVLLHMRLMSVVRGDASRAVVHITNLGADSNWTSPAEDAKAPSRRLVTIACADAVGLLEFISKLLATGGSRVLDADVMLSSDDIVLDRFVVEMHGRLRLDKLANYIEEFLQTKKNDGMASNGNSASSISVGSTKSNSPGTTTGSVYYRPTSGTPEIPTDHDIRQEMEGAVSLTEALASRSNLSQASLLPPGSVGSFQPLDRYFSLPADIKSKQAPMLPTSMSKSKDRSNGSPPKITLQKRSTADEHHTHGYDGGVHENRPARSMRERRPLVKREGKPDLDHPRSDSSSGEHSFDYMVVPDTVGGGVSNRIVPLIPFEELMLIETLGRGRVSTIYRAAWQHRSGPNQSISRINMLALKVAMVDPGSSDMSHVDELRREADIAARLHHPNICDLVGVAADPECFCLAYDFCEGGSLLSLLSDPKRYYEYLPIALDIANGMAYLHSRSVIHRDLKPSNILLTRDHRAKIADFGMSVANTGQELTAETGTYRYMAPEVIRHESYSSNADVYSFGICLWQLITREVPFATMTPIQAAYAVAEGNRPTIPASTPRQLREIIEACWDQDSRRRPSFTYIAMSLAEYAKIAFSPANVGAQTLHIANEMLATVEGNSTVNVDFSTPVTMGVQYRDNERLNEMTLSSSVGLEI